MSETTLSQAELRLRELLGELCLRPEVPAELAAELRQIYFVLRNHAYYMGYLKRNLLEVVAEFDQL